MAFLVVKFPDGSTLKYDPEAHVAYFKVKEGRVAKTEERAHNIMVDLDSRGNLIGVEIVSLSHFKHQATLALRKISNEYDIPTLKDFHPQMVSKFYQPCA